MMTRPKTRIPRKCGYLCSGCFRTKRRHIDYYCDNCGAADYRSEFYISGMSREGWLGRTMAADLPAYLHNPTDLWDEEWLKEHFGLSSFLFETGVP
jgi:hypothetical protein